MATSSPLLTLADYYGIEREYIDLAGVIRATSIDSIKALVLANGCDLSCTELNNEKLVGDYLTSLAGQSSQWRLPIEMVLAADQANQIRVKHSTEWQLISIDDSELSLEGQGVDSITLPALASGVYQLSARDKAGRYQSLLIVSPAKTPSLQDIAGVDQCWGLNASLYGIRSDRNVGFGDFTDLSELAAISAQAGAAFIGTHPLHALGWESSEVISPYSPSHRALLNQHHIALDTIPGLQGVSQARAIAKQALSDSSGWRDDDLISYSRHRLLHQKALRDLYLIFDTQATDNIKQSFNRFKASAKHSLKDFVLYECLSEVHGEDWRAWPAEYRVMPEALPKDLADSLMAQADFHYWVQWVADEQLAHAANTATQSGMSVGLYLDLAVGARRNGAESWCESTVVAQGVSVGAPPDHLSPAGQNWQLTAFAPKQLAALSYQPFRHMLRAVMRHAGVLRIDHVLGLSRSFWIPDDGSPGAYIKQPLDSLLALIKIEAQRAGTIVIGEDLGLVPQGFRKTIRDAGLYGYSVWQYEQDKEGGVKPSTQIEQQTLFCFATHDTPTLSGFEKGKDIDWWASLDIVDAATAKTLHTERQIKVEEFKNTGSVADGRVDDDSIEFTDLIHTGLSKSTAAMVNVQLEDILRMEDAQNLPGTVDEHPNWRRRYPTLVENLDKLDGFERIVEQMRLRNTD